MSTKPKHNNDFMNPPIEETIEAQTEPNPVGVVSDCKRLNVRTKPSVDSTPACVVDVGTVLVIVPDESTEEFYKVYTETGIEGYCMKKFVTIK